MFFTLQMTGGLQILDADKTIDYRKTEPQARYAFTFWAFPRAQWLTALREYLDFADEHSGGTGSAATCRSARTTFGRTAARCSPTRHDGDVFSIDPIHAPSDQAAWDRFLKEFNEFAAKRNGIPLLNQSPFVTRAHCEQAYGPRWTRVQRVGEAWIRSRGC